MNCPPKPTTNGATTASNMTTLLQKNCIKTLTVSNGVVVVGTTAAASNNSGNVVVNANGTLTATLAPLSNSAAAATTTTASSIQRHMIVSGQPLTVANTTRVLLPHELGNLATATTSIANQIQQSHQAQPIQQTFQYHQGVPSTQLNQQQQPQYIIYNHTNDVTTMFRPVTTATLTPTSNTIYHHQQQQQQQQTIPAVAVSQQNYVTQNNIPKPSLSGVVKYSNSNTLIAPTSMSSSSSSATASVSMLSSTELHYVHGNNAISTGAILKSTQQKAALNSNSTIATKHTSNVAVATTTHIPALGHINSENSNENSLRHEDLRHHNGSSATTDNNSINSLTNVANTTNKTTTHTINDVNNKFNHTPAANHNSNSSVSTNDADPVTAIDTIAANEIAEAQQHIQTSEQTDNGDEDTEPEPEIDIVINNVVCSFSVRCHLNLREIALNGRNVEFRRENGMVTMKLRRPYTTASIWSSGRITCTGATSEDQAKVGARRYARCLQSLGFPVRFNNFRVVNVLGTCSMPWAIRIVNFSEKYKKDASYEPELHPGVTYKLKTPKATLKIFSTGSITVTAASVANVQAAIEHIFPLVYEFRKKRTPVVTAVPPSALVIESETVSEDLTEFSATDFGDSAANQCDKSIKRKAIKRKYPFGLAENDPQEDTMIVTDDEEVDDIDDVDDEDEEDIDDDA